MEHRHPIGTRLRKTRGASWHGRVVGYYATVMTPLGYCVESEREPGSVQIYPAEALELAPADGWTERGEQWLAEGGP